MNLIQKQAETFIRHHEDYQYNYKKFVNDIRSELYEYKKDIYKIEFIGYIINLLKIDYDKHLKVCTVIKKEDCHNNIFFENSLFFLQEEIEGLESSLEPIEFRRIERDQLSTAINHMMAELEKIKFGQQITYDDLSDQLIELKDYYFLNKRNWIQLFLGKLTEMTAGGMISETLSKDLINIIEEHYPKLFQ